MVVVIAVLVLVVVLVIALAVYVRTAPDPTVPYDVLVRLHAIQKKMDVALFRLEARGEADRVRRELREDLQKHGRGP